MLPDDLLTELLETSRRAFIPCPDTRVIEREGWFQLITPSFRTGGMNSVSLSLLERSTADEVIRRTLDEYNALGLRFSWFVVPGSTPADLAERLERAGLRSHASKGMARRTDGPSLILQPGITVQEVDAATVEAYSDVSAEGWESAREPIHALNLSVLEDPQRQGRMFLARLDGAPVGAAALWTSHRSIYLLGGVVLPRARHRGVYQALVEARLAFARAHGISWATSQAMVDTSAPVLERCGFSTLCTFPVFSNRA